MADQLLSALLDGECSREELDRLLDEMERSPALKQAYSRLCLTRDALHGVRVAGSTPSICDGVMSQLDDAPLPVSEKVSDLDRRRVVRNSRWKPLAGLAAAAAIGALAVLVTVPESQRAPVGSSAAVLSAEATPQPVSLPAIERPRQLQLVSAQVPAPTDEAVEDDLSNYLMEHSNTAAGRGMGGTLSYARFAAHNAVYRPQAEEQR